MYAFIYIGSPKKLCFLHCVPQGIFSDSAPNDRNHHLSIFLTKEILVLGALGNSQLEPNVLLVSLFLPFLVPKDPE